MKELFTIRPAIAWTFIILVTFLMWALQTAHADTQTPHAQLSSLITVKAPDHGQPIELEAVDSIYRVSHDHKSPSKVQINQSGTYLVIASPQVALSQSNKIGCIDIWVKLNSQDVANTSVTKCWDTSKQSNLTDVLVMQAVMNLDKGDIMQIYMRSIPHQSAEILAIDNDGAPFTPSIIFTLIKQ